MRQEVFQTPGPLTLDLRVPSGEIEVVSLEGEETTVELDASGCAVGASCAGAPGEGGGAEGAFCAGVAGDDDDGDSSDSRDEFHPR